MAPIGSRKASVSTRRKSCQGLLSNAPLTAWTRLYNTSWTLKYQLEHLLDVLYWTLLEPHDSHILFFLHKSTCWYLILALSECMSLSHFLLSRTMYLFHCTIAFVSSLHLCQHFILLCLGCLLWGLIFVNLS